MVDKLGALELPITDAEPIGDPLRTTLGSFLQAALRYYCNDAWHKISPGFDVCERVDLNDPADSTFVAEALPCLAVYRDNRNRKVVYQGEDIAYRETTLVVLWIPSLDVQCGRAMHEPFFNAIESAMMVSLSRGRVPTWIVDGDTDTSASYRGSFIGTPLGLMKPIRQSDIRFDDYTVTIDMLGEQPRKYPSLRMMLTICEQYQPDPTIGTVPSAIDVHTVGGYTLTSNGIGWSILKDPGGYL